MASSLVVGVVVVGIYIAVTIVVAGIGWIRLDTMDTGKIVVGMVGPIIVDHDCMIKMGNSGLGIGVQ